MSHDKNTDCSDPDCILCKGTGSVPSNLEPKLMIGNYVSILDQFKPEYKGTPIQQLLLLYKGSMMEDNHRDINISSDMIDLLDATDEKPSYVHAPYTSFFLNKNLQANDFIVKGVLVIDEILENALTVGFIAMGQNKEYACIFGINAEGIIYGENEKHRDLIESVATFIIKLIRFIHSEKEIEFIEQDFSKTNVKRISRGKCPVSKAVYIRLHGTLSAYSDRFCAIARSKIQHKFLVRGHFVHYKSDRYVNVKNQKRWIRPFWKGIGEKIIKQVVVQK